MNVNKKLKTGVHQYFVGTKEFNICPVNDSVYLKESSR